MKNLFLSFALLAATALTAVSCSEDKTDQGGNVLATEVKVTPTTPSIVVGTIVELKAEVLPKNTSNKKVRWTSRDTAVATVDETTGIVTGVAVGETQISAMCGKVIGTVTITVTAAPIPVEAVTLSKLSFELLEGKTETITAIVTPDNATDATVTWLSDKPEIATVADGLITAIAEGAANITATAGEKSATCVVTVKKPAAGNISAITLPYLQGLSGRTVKMTATGFAIGDKVKIADFFQYQGEATVKNVTEVDAEFDMPANAPLDRSYVLTIMREITEKQTATLRYNSEMVAFPYALGYYFTASTEVVADNAEMRGARRGYLPGDVFTHNTTNNTFDVSKADLKLCTLNLTAGRLDLEYATGLTSLSPLKELVNLSNVTYLAFANSHLEAIDMTMFPEATELRAWGDPGSQYNGIKSISFGAYKTAPVCKLQHIQLERNQVTGVVDLRNCQYLKTFNINDNQITSINLGIANTDQVLRLDEILAENNKIVELNIENCGRIRKLMLANNPIERLTLLNNSKGTCLDGDKSEQYMYILKNQENFSLSWATSGERHFHVEKYWWRVFSGGNATENSGKTEFEGGWLIGCPIAKALSEGVKVTCWTYHGEDALGDSHPIDGHVHEGGTAPCN